MDLSHYVSVIKIMLHDFYVIAITDKVQPVYYDDKAFSTPSDSNSQFIILNWWFYQHTGDLNFFREMYRIVS